MWVFIGSADVTACALTLFDCVIPRSDTTPPTHIVDLIVKELGGRAIIDVKKKKKTV